MISWLRCRWRESLDRPDIHENRSSPMLFDFLQPGDVDILSKRFMRFFQAPRVVRSFFKITDVFEPFDSPSGSSLSSRHLNLYCSSTHAQFLILASPRRERGTAWLRFPPLAERCFFVYFSSCAFKNRPSCPREQSSPRFGFLPELRR